MKNDERGSVKERNDFYGFTVTRVTNDYEPYSERPPFLVEGILHHTITLLYGEAKIGKSTLAAALAVALANGESDFLARKISTIRPLKVGVIAGDFGDDEAYGDQLRKRLDNDTNVMVYGLDRPPTRRVWEGLQLDVRQRQLDVVVVDNLTSFVNGSLNDDVAVNEFYDQLDRFVRDDVAVILVAHISEKTGEHGKSKRPMGSSAITARARWLWRVESYRGNLRLTFEGNGHAPHEISVTEADGIPRFDVLGTADATALSDRRRKRSKEILDKNARIGRFVADLSPTLTAKAKAELIKAEFGGAVSTHQTNLSRGLYRVD